MDVEPRAGNSRRPAVAPPGALHCPASLQHVDFALNTRDILPDDAVQAVLVGRLYDPAAKGPSVVVLRGDRLIDVSSLAATMSDLLENEDPVALLSEVSTG